MKKFFYFILLFFLKNIYAASTPTTITSKQMTFKHLLKLHESKPFTFICEQRFNPRGDIHSSCKKCPTQRIRWMPIVPLQRLATPLNCFNYKLCTDKQGMRFKGLRCCNELDPLYQKASLDLHNYVPENPLIKQLRRNYEFGEVLEKQPLSKQCHFYIDKKHKIIEIDPSKRGFIARTYLYMHDTYDLSLSQQEITLYLSWHQQFPPDAWEQERNAKIKAIQGNSNHYTPG